MQPWLTFYGFDKQVAQGHKNFLFVLLQQILSGTGADRAYIGRNH
jgi:hypothetical protein